MSIQNQIMNNSKLRFLVFCCCVLTMITACTTSNDFVNEYQSIPDGWNKSKSVDFNFESLDTLKTYNAFINLRTTNDYPFSNLFLLVKLTDPEGYSLTDTLQYQMANPDGSMLGHGFTDVKEHNLIWRKKVAFKKQGVYTVEINHAMRKLNTVKGEEILPGVTEVGLQLQ